MKWGVMALKLIDQPMLWGMEPALHRPKCLDAFSLCLAEGPEFALDGYSTTHSPRYGRKARQKAVSRAIDLAAEVIQQSLPNDRVTLIQDGKGLLEFGSYPVSSLVTRCIQFQFRIFLSDLAARAASAFRILVPRFG
jgi:hypothetical protein